MANFYTVTKKNFFSVAGGTTTIADIENFFSIIIVDGANYSEGSNIIVSNIHIVNSVPQLILSHTTGSVNCYATKHLNSINYDDDISNGHPNTWVEDMDSTHRSTAIKCNVTCVEMIELGVQAIPASIVFSYIPAVHPPNISMVRISKVLRTPYLDIFNIMANAVINNYSPTVPDTHPPHSFSDVIWYSPNYPQDDPLDNIVLIDSIDEKDRYIRTISWVWFNFGARHYTIIVKNNGVLIHTFTSVGRICKSSATFRLGSASTNIITFEFSTGELKTQTVILYDHATSNYSYNSNTTVFTMSGELSSCTVIIGTKTDYLLGIHARVDYQRSTDGSNILNDRATNVVVTRVGDTDSFTLTFDAAPFIRNISVSLLDANGVEFGYFTSRNDEPFIPPT